VIVSTFIISQNSNGRDIRFRGVNEMARRKASPIEEASRKGLENGRYYNPWRSAKQKQDELFRKLRKENS
jgi:hypothetical protein